MAAHVGDGFLGDPPERERRLGRERARLAGGDERGRRGEVRAVLGHFLISGAFFPASRLPSAFEAVATVFPLAHLAHGLRQAIVPAAGGIRIEALDLAVLLAWGLLGLAVAVRRFEWLPIAAAGAG